MTGYRLSQVARDDIISILIWTRERFGEEARQRCEVLITTALRDASSRTGDVGHTTRPELEDDVFIWHLVASRTHAPGRNVGRPRHCLICRFAGEVLVVGRVLHDAMDAPRHVDPGQSWE